jgi:type I restriction enzyme R subunit
MTNGTTSDKGLGAHDDLSLSEADTRAKLIDPALKRRGWKEENIRREVTAGTIELVGKKARQKSKGRVDYTLRIAVSMETQPVALALIEAKAARYHAAHGLDQGRAYGESKRLNVPFVFSSNGHMFVEYDRFTDTISEPKPMSEFPTPAELRQRYEQGMGFSLSSPSAAPLLTPYSESEGTRRYYQDAAIRATLEKIAQAEQAGEAARALLALATGAGKTYIAVNLLRRISDAGKLRRALFVCDRDTLRTQAAKAFRNGFGADADIVTSSDPQKNARVLIATYQTLGLGSAEGEEEEEGASKSTFLEDNYPEDYFSHIIIDECHRSGFGKWSKVLTRNSQAVQIGLTATPRKIETKVDTPEAKKDERITADNEAYFGKAVYEYTITQGVEDGYLAFPLIIGRYVNRGETPDEMEILRKQILESGMTYKDYRTGRTLTSEEILELYTKTTFEQRIMLPDRILAMCHDLFHYFLESGNPEQKTIVFCASDDHAREVAHTLERIYTDWCRENEIDPKPKYAFKCTAESDGNSLVPDLRGSNHSHFIATTVDLLSTGVDIPNLENIVFFSYMKSPIRFYQMVGRGTRLNPATDKLMFNILDYTNVRRLFGQEFKTKPPRSGERGSEGPKEPRQIIQVEDFEYAITDAGEFVPIEVDGKEELVTVEEYKARLAAKLKEQAPDLSAFTDTWVNPDARRLLIDNLARAGYSASLVQTIDEMTDFDLFDVLAKLAYEKSPLTRKDRTERFNDSQKTWLATMPEPAAKVLQAFMMQFERSGTEAFENREVWRTAEIIKAGGRAALKTLPDPAGTISEAKRRMFSA